MYSLSSPLDCGLPSTPPPKAKVASLTWNKVTRHPRVSEIQVGVSSKRRAPLGSPKRDVQRADMLKMYSKYSKIVNFDQLKDPTEIWELQELVGEGTYGEVYAVRNKQTGQKAAAKILENIHETVEEIEQEYQILKAVSNNPNFPQFYGLYLKKENKLDDQLWIVMELCQNGSVTDLSKDLVTRKNRLDEVLIAFILRETLKAINHMHKCHYMHRDIKGHNILMTSDGSIKLVDFGVSGLLDHSLANRRTSVGTPYWMAPEVIACEQQLDYVYDIRCDVWSLGVTAIELADGDPPLSEQHPMRALFKIPRSPPPTFKNPDLWSKEFQDFVAQCCIKDYEKRPFTSELFDHPFFKQIPDDVSLLKQKLTNMVHQMNPVIHTPDVTTKHGQLKSKRASKRPVNVPDDLATLETLDPDVITRQLEERYKHSIIYTYIGDILLAVNPFRPLNIYSEKHLEQYTNAPKGALPPHIYGLADQAFHSMLHLQINQCIVISGESGAGKTESANYLLQQLTNLGQAPDKSLQQRLLQANPLMEAFGNSQTVINDNSSRFGKYLDMIFNNIGSVNGARITEYLLEKSRIIQQAPGEQSFHIFYYILAGLGNLPDDKYFLKSARTFRYISQYQPNPSTLAFNSQKFQTIKQCFDIIGFTSEEVDEVFCVLSSILHIGNIDFTAQETRHGSDSCTVIDNTIINNVANLLGVDPKELIDSLTSTGILARGEVIIRCNTRNEALDARDAMAKALYGRLFSWIVNKINCQLKPKKEASQEFLCIGILDIFGFENFQKNSFEQLCINIANEQIQYYFNQHIFAWELQEYESEGIDGAEVDYEDNRPVLDMFLMKPMGLLALLDEESLFPKGTDQSLTAKFHQNIKCPAYIKPKAEQNLNFIIEHYAGKVEYQTTGFLEKNRDRLPTEVIHLFRMSIKNVVKALFHTPLTKIGNLSTGISRNSQTGGTVNNNYRDPRQTSNSRYEDMGHGQGSTSMTRIQQTVSSYFRYSLMDLLSKMVAGTPHFVRCLKPNTQKIPAVYDKELIKTQLRYTGVLETTRIRREGFSHRIPFGEFLQRYYVLMPSWVKAPKARAENCSSLLQHVGFSDYAFGKTKVFLRYYHVEELVAQCEKIREQKVLEEKAIKIQKSYRGHRGRKVAKVKKEERKQQEQAATLVQSQFRGYQQRKKENKKKEKRKRRGSQLTNEEHAAITIQRSYRRYMLKKSSKKMMDDSQIREVRAAIILQAYYRTWKCRTFFQQLLFLKTHKEMQYEDFVEAVQIYNFDIYTWQIATNYDYKAKSSSDLVGETLEKFKKKMFDSKQVGRTPYYDALTGSATAQQPDHLPPQPGGTPGSPAGEFPPPPQDDVVKTSGGAFKAILEKKGMAYYDSASGFKPTEKPSGKTTFASIKEKLRVNQIKKPMPEESLQTDSPESSEIMPRANKPYNSTQHNYKKSIEYDDPPAHVGIEYEREQPSTSATNAVVVSDVQNSMDSNQKQNNIETTISNSDSSGKWIGSEHNIVVENYQFPLEETAKKDNPEIIKEPEYNRNPVVLVIGNTNKTSKESNHVQNNSCRVLPPVGEDLTMERRSIRPSRKLLPSSENKLSAGIEDVQWRVDESRNFDTTVKRSSESINKLPVNEEYHWINTIDDSIRTILNNHRRRSHDFRQSGLMPPDVNRRASDGGEIYNNCRVCEDCNPANVRNSDYQEACYNGGRKFPVCAEPESYPKPSIVLDYHFNESIDNDSISVHFEKDSWPEMEDEEDEEEAFHPACILGGYYCQADFNDNGDETSTDENDWPSLQNCSDQNRNDKNSLCNEIRSRAPCIDTRPYRSRFGRKDLYKLKNHHSHEDRTSYSRCHLVESKQSQEFGNIHAASKDYDSCLGLLKKGNPKMTNSPISLKQPNKRERKVDHSPSLDLLMK
ncbi:myosin-IIIb-like isoform X6 [Octopus sinensis]|uniref:non-specific serine/threonine protein kinase n=1 Tax=Octopus sinensis TaxID=2607531 RepID=A0A7E6FM20_9MOLL|nr:myosin-IIIb-like isoform X6 [Octopus sinensis]